MRESRSSKLERHRWIWDGVTFVGCLGVLVALGLPWLAWPHWRKTWYVRKDSLATLLQVVPATVVAVFIFAVGAVFVIVQIISPTLGSRAIEDLLVRRRARICVIAGMVLLLACLALAALALIREKHLKQQWEASAASALALATLIYVPFSIWCISSIFHGFVSPRSYSTLLSRRQGLGRLPAFKLAVWPHRALWHPPLTSDLAFHRLRALRQWLRTACRTGESRDIVFALRGFQKLVGYYCDEARLEEDKPPGKKLRSKLPAEYFDSGEIVNSDWRVLLDPDYVPPDRKSQLGWFGAEFGRALARSAEVGIRSEVLLLRDFDRLVVVLGAATLQLSGLESPEEERIDPKVQSLPEEAGFLLDRIAEIGMYVFQVRDDAYSDWFVRPALILASLESKLEKLDVQVTGKQFLESSLTNGQYQPVHGHRSMQEHCLAGRALAAWCLVNYTFQQAADGASTQAVPAHGRHRLGEKAIASPELWNEAKRLAMSPAMHPSWMPLDRDDPEGQKRLSTFFDDLQSLVRAGGHFRCRANSP